MKDAFGGILNIVFIAVFLVIVEGILGMVVNYSKAFRMKNEIITALEQYEGLGCCKTGGATKGEKSCTESIRESARSIGYNPPVDLKSVCDSIGYRTVDDFFCMTTEVDQSGEKIYYRVVTQVDINIPIINKIMSLSAFQVHGDTRLVKKYDDGHGNNNICYK